jgi:DNA-binding CsgD family transcriptional regulator
MLQRIPSCPPFANVVLRHPRNASCCIATWPYVARHALRTFAVNKFRLETIMGPIPAALAAATHTTFAPAGSAELVEPGGLIEAIYDAGFDAQRWPGVFARIARHIGAQHVNLTVLPPDCEFPLDQWEGIDVSFAHSYAQHYGGFDPLVPQVRRWPAGTLVTDTMLRPLETHESSAFVQEWVRPQRFYTVAFANVLCEGGMAGVLGALRRERRFYSDDELDVLRALLPHLRNALRVQQHIAPSLRDSVSNPSSDAPAEALDALAHGVLIVDADARIVFANRAATTQLAHATGLRSERDTLTASTPAATQQLRALVARAAHPVTRTGGAMLIGRPPPDEPLQVLISPLGAHRSADLGHGARPHAAMLIVIDPKSSRRGVETRLVALFGLTPAEARVACEVGKGLNPKDVAEALQVLPSTVRTHLHHVFAKTATRRQAELMRLIAQLAIARGD